MCMPTSNFSIQALYLEAAVCLVIRFGAILGLDQL